MRELSIFVDESGDWGEYNHHSPYYIITFVFHDQDTDISDDLSKLDTNLKNIGYSGHCLHAGPIIRGEEDYKEVDIAQRQRILKKIMGFIRRMDIRFRSFYIEKKQFDNSLEAIGRISKQLSVFIRDHLEFFLEFDTVKVYYDNGQTEVNKIPRVPESFLVYTLRLAWYSRRALHLESLIRLVHFFDRLCGYKLLVVHNGMLFMQIHEHCFRCKRCIAELIRHHL